jgi:hypothetical protein
LHRTARLPGGIRAQRGTVTGAQGRQVYVLWDGGVEGPVGPQRLVLGATTERDGSPSEEGFMTEPPREQASVYRELGRHHDHADSVKAELKATERHLEAPLGEIAGSVNRGTETREKEIEIRADDEAGLAREICLDTGEDIHDRKLEEKERPVAMFPAGGRGGRWRAATWRGGLGQPRAQADHFNGVFWHDGEQSVEAHVFRRFDVDRPDPRPGVGNRRARVGPRRVGPPGAE